MACKEERNRECDVRIKLEAIVGESKEDSDSRKGDSRKGKKRNDRIAKEKGKQSERECDYIGTVMLSWQCRGKMLVRVCKKSDSRTSQFCRRMI